MGIYEKIVYTQTLLIGVFGITGLLLNFEFGEEGWRKYVGNTLIVIAGLCILGIVITCITWLWLEA